MVAWESDGIKVGNFSSNRTAGIITRLTIASGSRTGGLASFLQPPDGGFGGSTWAFGPALAVGL